MPTPETSHRLTRRVSVRTEVWLGQDGIFTRSEEWLSDLSLGGAFIESAPTANPGAVLNLRFQLPTSSAPIDCTAIVRHTRGGQGLGVEFVDLSPDSRARLRDFVDGGAP